jgi:hypothetical protein
MNWDEKLEAWGYDRADELSLVLDEIGLDPEHYNTPLQLAGSLSQLIQGDMIYVQGEFRPLAWYDIILDFFAWLWSMIAPYAADIGLIAVGAFITWFAGGLYKAIGLVPMLYGVFDIMKRFGVIG